MSLASPSWIHLDSEHVHVAIDPIGAQLSVLKDADGRDWLWDGDPAFWTGRAPVLFPVVGGLNGGICRWRGRTYPLSRHGFARARQFQIVHTGAGAATFRLHSDDETRAVYPFDFELDVSFRIANGALTVVASARNTGHDAMPASLGFHPAFRWPTPGAASRDGHVLAFECEEAAPIRRLDSGGLLMAAAQPTPVLGSHLALRDALFTSDVVIFDHLVSRRLRYRAEGGPTLEVAFPDATYLGLWSKPGAGFVCIEPWRGVADPSGFSGELDAKPGIEVIAPGDALSLTMVIEVRS